MVKAAALRSTVGCTFRDRRTRGQALPRRSFRKAAAEILINDKDAYDKELLKGFVENLNEIAATAKERAEKIKIKLYRRIKEANQA